MNRKLIASATLGTLLALSACSSDDDDDTVPGTEDGAGDTSQLAPGEDSTPPSNTPGGDTSAIAGLWDATEEGALVSRYVEIADDGLWTEYQDESDGSAGSENCYSVIGPYTLTPESVASDEYGISDDRSFTATTNADDTELTITFADEETQRWEAAASGVVVENLQPCE